MFGICARCFAANHHVDVEADTSKSRVSALINLFIYLKAAPTTDERHSMAFDILRHRSHYGGTMKGCQDRYDLLATDQATQLLVVRAVGDVVSRQNELSRLKAFAADL